MATLNENILSIDIQEEIIMSKFATVSVTIRGETVPFTVKSAAAAKKVKRLIEAMQLRDVSEIAIDSHTVDFTEVADVLKVVFRICDDS